MDDISGAPRLPQAGNNSRLHLAAVISVIIGAALLAAAAFLLSYARIHEIALSARVSPSLAALYPLIFDITLVIACVAALALRGAPWWMRYSAVLIIMILLAVVAAGEALHSAGINLPRRPTAAALAAVPWALFLIGFGLGLLVLRYQRKVRAAARGTSPGETPEPAREAGSRKPPLSERNSHSPRWNTEPEATNVRIVQAEPKRTNLTPGQQRGTQNGRLTSAQGNGHHHGHGHQHRPGPSG